MSLMAERSATCAGRISTFVLITIPVYCRALIAFCHQPTIASWIASFSKACCSRAGTVCGPRSGSGPQEFNVDIEVDCDLSEPGKSDRIEDSVDYRQIRSIAKEVIEGESQKLL